jgi:site-specific DNA-methyltransferase (adenine-specific)
MWMKPFYEDKWVKIFHGDCREILPTLDVKVDLVLTDPPYGVGNMVSGTMSKNRLHKTKYLSFEDSPEYVRERVIPVIEGCLEDFGRMIITPGYRCMRYYPAWDGFGCFYQPAGVGMQLWGFSDAQPILYYGKPYDIGKTIKACSYTVCEPPSCDEHPCSKPLNVWLKIISSRSQENNLILDPFLGSGTTCYCAKRLNRYSIGIEIEEKYCEIAAKRCMQQVMELNFPIQQTEKQVELSL